MQDILSSLTVCNTSFVTLSIQPIFSIHIQQENSKLLRYFRY